ncbi:oligosaccharide flippase family protein [Kineococcus sp. TBRC 1896]|uniref:Oligosaccharide flippase family protein n=1 Tax=Kineococcus mangrovi TaxID=1660183 RepID=A0ABV4HXS5_9ACTN
MSPSLGRAAGRGAVITLGTQGVRLVVQVIGLAVLGRLLAPHDYGLVAIVTVLVSAGEVFRDFGLSAAAIQAKTLSRGQRDNLFWINTGIGLVLALLLCALSPVLAHVYRDDRLTLIAVVMSGIFVLNGISTQYRAGLARSLQFGRLSGAELLGQVTGVAVAVTVAALGGGYWALAAQWISAQSLALVLVFAWSRWRPGRIDRTASVRPFLNFGSALLGSTLLNNAVNYTSPLALGLAGNPVTVGLYNRAQQLVTMPLVQIQAPTTRVALPILSRVQDDPKQFTRMLLRGQLALLTLIGLVFAVLFAQAPAAVRVLLGPQWGDVVPLFRILLLAGFMQAATYAASWVFQARGLTGSQLRYSLATRPLFVVAICIGAAFGPTWTAAAYAGSLLAGWPLSLWWLRRLGGVPTGRMARNGLQGALLATTAGAASWGATHVVTLPPVLDLVVGGLAVALTAAIAFALVPSYRREVGAVKKTLSRRKSRKSSDAGSGTGAVPAPRSGHTARRGRATRAVARRLLIRAWYSSGVPTALDRSTIRRTHRRAVRSAALAGTHDGRRHLVVAAPGAGNIGDQALLEAVLEGSDLPVLLATSGATPTLLAPLAERVELLDVPHLVYGTGTAHRASVRRFGQALARASHVSLIGADVMDGRYSLPASVRRASTVTAAARAGVDTRVVGFSWSERPRTAARRELRRAARAGVRLLVRDPVSAERLAADGVSPVIPVADVVFSARTRDDAAADRYAPEGARTALVNASGLIAKRADLLGDYEVVVRDLLARGLRVVLLPHVLRTGSDDLTACEALAERFSPDEVTVVRELLTPAQVRGLAARATLVVTGRMHLAVMASMSAVPAVTLATQGKVEGLMRLLGTPELELAPRSGFSAHVPDLVDRVLPDDSPTREALQRNLEMVTGLSRRNLAGLRVDTVLDTADA